MSRGTSLGRGSVRAPEVVAVGLWLASVLAGVGIFPIVTNDGHGYLAYASDLAGGGLVDQGYRQVGYPLWLAMSEAASSIVSDPLFLAALGQRVLLGAGVWALAHVAGWWAMPGIVFVLLPSVSVLSNYMLTESLAIPLVLLLAAVTLRIVTERRAPNWSWYAAAGIALALLAVRFTFAVFGIVPLVGFLIAWRRDASRRIAAAALGIYIGAASLFTIGLTAENAREWDHAFPNTRTARSAYWATWQAVFVLRPENRDDPALAEFLDGGTPYGLIGDIDSSALSGSEQNAAFEDAIEELVSAASLDLGQLRLEAFLGALRGGRLNDLRDLNRRAISARTPEEMDAAMFANAVARREGIDVYQRRFDEEGEVAGRPAAAPPLTDPDVGSALTWLLPASLLVAILALARRRWLWAGVAALPMLALAVAAGFAVADNVRFLVATSTWSVVMAGPLLRALVSSRPNRPDRGQLGSDNG